VYLSFRRIRCVVSVRVFHQRLLECLFREKGPKMWGWLVCYLASSTKLLALLGVGDTVLGVKVAIFLHSKYKAKLNQYTNALSDCGKEEI